MNVNPLNWVNLSFNKFAPHKFKFTNTGKEPLIISDAKGSCGCTTPNWPKEPIRPGETGVIKVKYATDRIGAFEKTITLTSNADTPSKVIKIKGVVNPDPAGTTTAAPAVPAPLPVPAVEIKK